MPAADIDIMAVPAPCGVCGRPTTQFSRRLGVPYCGRDDDQLAAPGPVEGFGPPAAGGRRWGRRRPRRDKKVRLASP